MTSPETSHPHLGRTILITVVATIGGFLFGFDSGVINGTVDGLQKAFGSDQVGTGFNVASMLIGCAVGAFGAGNLANHIGRRGVLILSAVCFLISAWGSGIAGGSMEFIIYRLLGGLAVGAASVLSPAYISEIAPAHIRGRLSSLQQVAIITGLFSAFFSNYGLASLAEGSAQNILAWGFEAWRWMFWVEMLPAALFLIALGFIPESPRYLVAAGKRDRAIEVIAQLHPGSAEAKVGQIENSLERDHQPRLRDVAGPAFGLQPIVWIGIALAMFQQLAGINVVFYYGAVLWQSVGFTEADALLINVISGALSIAACVGAIACIDHIGRKPLLLGGSIGMAVFLGTLALIFASTPADPESGKLLLEGTPGILALIAANLYVVAFNLTWGPVVWVTLGEMFPNQLRGAAIALSGLALWTANFAITLTFPMLLTGLGLGVAYGIYTAFAALSFPFIRKFIHETRGRELELMGTP
jgi:SP family sugar:H+ symporter-like MFS transporter